MSEQQTVNIKQRILGAIVLVSMGVIIIPLLLNGGPDLSQSISGSNIPQIPKPLTRELPAFSRPENMPKPKTIIARPVGDFNSDPKANKNPTATKMTTTTTNASVNSHYEKASKPSSAKIMTAYTLQIASFRKKNNAFTLRDSLRKKRFKAYVESITTSKGKMYRLRVGPYLKFEQISTAQKQIEKQFKVSKTVIVQYRT